MEDNKEFIFRDKRRTVNPEVGEEKSPSTNPDANAEKPGRKGGSAPKMELNFSTFVLSLSTSAAMNLGGYTDPVSGLMPQNLELAKQSIDILGMLKEKTRGNLEAEEEKLLDSALYELRMRYVDEVKKKGS
jgi:hypothetical protein